MAQVKCGNIKISIPSGADPEFYRTFLDGNKKSHKFTTTYKGKNIDTTLYLDIKHQKNSKLDKLKGEEQKQMQDHLFKNYMMFTTESSTPEDFARYKEQIIDCTQYSVKYYKLLEQLLQQLDHSQEDTVAIKYIHEQLSKLTSLLQDLQPQKFLYRIIQYSEDFAALAALVREHKKRDFNKDIMQRMNKLVSTLRKELDDLPKNEQNVILAKQQLATCRNKINYIGDHVQIETKLSIYLKILKDLQKIRKTINDTQKKLRYIDKISQIQKRNGEIIDYEAFTGGLSVDLNNKNVPKKPQLASVNNLKQQYEDKQEEYTDKKHQEQEQKTLEQLRENKFEKQVDDFIRTISIKNENQKAKKTTKASRSNKPHQKKAKQPPQPHLSIVPMEKKEQHNYFSYLLVTLLGGVLLGGIIALLMYNDKQKKIQNQQARLQLKSAQDRQPNI